MKVFLFLFWTDLKEPQSTPKPWTVGDENGFGLQDQDSLTHWMQGHTCGFYQCSQYVYSIYQSRAKSLIERAGYSSARDWFSSALLLSAAFEDLVTEFGFYRVLTTLNWTQTRKNHYVSSSKHPVLGSSMQRVFWKREWAPFSCCHMRPSIMRSAAAPEPAGTRCA